MTGNAGEAAPKLGRPLLKRIAKGAGVAILLASLGFIAFEVARNWDEISRWRPNRFDFVVLAALMLLYAAMLYVLAEVWHRIVCMFGPESRRRTWRSYALTQIARYLPGNVAHLLGRAIVLRDGPLTDRQLGMATALELVLVPSGAIMALGLSLLLVPSGASLVDSFDLPWSTVAVGGLLAAALLAGAAWITQRHWLDRASEIGLVILLCTIFMLALGGIFGVVVVIVGDGPFWMAAMAGICAWLVGYATPGAPGGIGPREAVLFLLLSDVVPSGELLIAATLLRLVTIMGDVLCFATGAVFLRNAA